MQKLKLNSKLNQFCLQMKICRKYNTNRVANFRDDFFLLDMSHPVKNEEINNKIASSSDPASSQAAQINSSPTENRFTPQKYTFLPTAIILIDNAHGVPVPLRVILDIGSNANVITEEAARRIDFPRNDSNNHEFSAKIKSMNSSFESNITCLIVPRLNSTFPRDIPWNTLEILPLNLADPGFNRAGNVDMIIGSWISFKCISSETIELKNGAYLKESQFGWIVGGSIDTSSSDLAEMFYVNHVNSSPEVTTEVTPNDESVVETMSVIWGWDRAAKIYYE